MQLVEAKKHQFGFRGGVLYVYTMPRPHLEIAEDAANRFGVRTAYHYPR